MTPLYIPAPTPADDHVTMLNTVGTYAVVIVIIAVLIAGILALYRLGERSAGVNGFIDDFTVTPDDPEVVEYVEAVDAAMAAGAEARQR